MKTQFQKSALRTVIAAFAAVTLAIVLATGCGNSPTGPGSGSIVLPEGYAWVGDVPIPMEGNITLSVRVACIPHANNTIDATMQMMGIWQPMAPMATYSVVNGKLHLTELDTGDTLIVTYNFSNNGNTMTVVHSEFGTVVLTKTSWPVAGYDPGGVPDTSNGGSDPNGGGDHALVLGSDHAWVLLEGVPPMFGVSFVFNADNTYSTFIYIMIGWFFADEGTWYTEGDRLFITDEYGDTEEVVYAVAGNTLTMDTIEHGPMVLTRTLWTGEVIDVDELFDFDFMSKSSDSKLPNWVLGRMMKK